MWDVVCLCVLRSYRYECILAGLIEHYAMQRLSCSVTHLLCSPVTHAHTHTDQMTGTWSKLLGTLQVLAHIVQFLYICPQFCFSLSVSLSHSVCLCLSASAYLFLRFTSKQQVSSLDSFVSLPPPSQRPTEYCFLSFSGGKFLKAWMQTRTWTHAYKYCIFFLLTKSSMRRLRVAFTVWANEHWKISNSVKSHRNHLYAIFPQVVRGVKKVCND